MAENRDTLEAALAASWDRDTLAVYADYLQADGDPRGELIALDLQIEAHGNTVELSKRRTSLLLAWLGALVPADNVHASWVGDSLKFGFVEDLVFDGSEPNALARLAQVFVSPAGPYVRGLTMSGTTAALEAALDVIARGEHRWLTRLSIGTVYQPPTITPSVVSDAFRAMPNLESLELRDQLPFAPFSHPSIKRLAIRGEAVYAALGEGASFDDVVELDVDLSVPFGDYDDDYAGVTAEGYVQPTLPKITYPSLRRLELAELYSAHRFLMTLDARAHVTHLKVPQLRNTSDHDELLVAMRDMPALEVVEVARGSYYDPPDLPNVRLVRAETWQWPTQELADGQGLRIYQPLAKYGDTVAILDAVYVMEDSFETLAKSARDAWSQLWRFIAGLQSTPAPFPARVLADAVEALPGLMQNGWRELREELTARRPLAAESMVKIERCKT